MNDSYNHELRAIDTERLYLRQELSNIIANLTQSGKYDGIGMSTAVLVLKKQMKKL